MKPLNLSGQRRSRAGVTLIELLVVAVIMMILTLALSYVFAGGVDLERIQRQRQSRQSRLNLMEQRITIWIQSAKLGQDNDDATTYFIGLSESGDESLGSDRLTFTTLAPAVPLASQESQDDFETQQQTLGPIGGIAEVSLGLTPVADAGDRSGLFLRQQRPSDGDSTQGGLESLLEADIETIGFEFWNGNEWVTTWDTVQGGERRLPAAVRVNYRLRDSSEDAIHRFIVAIPTSDVDAQNPSNNGVQL
jgi:type II secretory pathway pseudopilin PulG